MKKFLLSLSVMALGVSAVNAAEYTLFDANNFASIEWTGDANGYTADVTVDGKTFTIATKKSKSTFNLVKPGDQIRVYKNTDLVITSNDVVMKEVVLTGMNDYAGAQTVSEGWTTTANDLLTTLNNASGSKTVTFSATANQFRCVSIVVSDEVGGVTPPAPVEAKVVNNVAETIALENGTPIKVNYELTVAFVSFSNVYSVDAAGNFIQVYGKNSYQAGDVIPAGWEGKYVLFQGTTPEIEPVGDLPTSTKQEAFTPKEVAAADITTAMVNNVVLVKNVVLDAASPATKDNFTGKVGDVELSLRNNYTLPSVEAGTYDMTLLVTVFKDAPSLYVISYNNDGSGVEEIEAEANGEAVYYNLQGVKVAEPENGLYIKVQGKKATKVFVRK